MRIIYSSIIRLYSFLIRIAALLGNKKAKLWVLGRENWQNQLQQEKLNEKNVTWFHVASLGEFEQARPLIEQIKKKSPDIFILISFFSPSGYEIRKDYQFADKVIYLPIDTQRNAKRFLDLVQPNRIFFIKYEFWFNYLYQIQERKIDCFLVSGIFRKEQHFFKPYGGWFKKHLHAFSHFFVQNKESKNILNLAGISNVTVTGDTRLDQVKTISDSSFNQTRFESFSKNSDVILFGSSWEKEDELSVALSKSNLIGKIIIAPHEIDLKKIKLLKLQFGSQCKLLSETTTDEDLTLLQILIIDQIGLLSKLYRYAKIAFIGGGFGKGIHNTLEAVVYGIPVLFGPNYHKFQEAHDLISIGAGFCVNNSEEFNTTISGLLRDELHYQNTVIQCKNYVQENIGATKKIIAHIYSN